MASSTVPVKPDDIRESFPARDLTIYNTESARRAKGELRKRHCQICGEVFEPEDVGLYAYKMTIPTALVGVWHGEGKKSKTAWFHCYKCYRDAQKMVEAIRAKKKPRLIEPEPRKTVEKRCWVCGRAFQTASNNARYCSKGCRQIALNAKKRERAARDAGREPEAGSLSWDFPWTAILQGGKR